MVWPGAICDANPRWRCHHNRPRAAPEGFRISHHLISIAILVVLQHRMLVLLSFTGTAFITGIAAVAVWLDCCRETTVGDDSVALLLLRSLSALHPLCLCLASLG